MYTLIISKLTNIKIPNFNMDLIFHFSYEPELHPGVTYKLYNPKATLKIFSTGGVTITGMPQYNQAFLYY